MHAHSADERMAIARGHDLRASSGIEDVYRRVLLAPLYQSRRVFLYIRVAPTLTYVPANYDVMLSLHL